MNIFEELYFNDYSYLWIDDVHDYVWTGDE